VRMMNAWNGCVWMISRSFSIVTRSPDSC
jgi:hypothetical protein